MAQPLVYRRLRAPAEDGGVLLDPPAEKLPPLISANVAALTMDVDIGGRSLSKLRREAREQLALAAASYTGKYADLGGLNGWLERETREQLERDAAEFTEHAWLDDRALDHRLYLVGHQPELFHPGVWLKTFVLDALAKRDNATAVHVLIDNDEAGAPAIQVPTGSLTAPRIESVAFDEATGACAWEELLLSDAAKFRSFDNRVREAIAPLVAAPLATMLWRDVEATLQSTNNLGQALAQLRHRMEIAWGLQTLEVPLSRLVDAPAFQFFSAYILAELPRFREIHNSALDEYRAVHKLRSASQPLPNLAKHDDWCETPFWVWSANDATRRKLLFKRSRDGWTLADGLTGSNTWTFSTGHRDATQGIFYTIKLLRGQSVKIRPRALVTTMMLRLLASDLFIHGVGGAKYDQVTDRIIEDFFGIEPPGFLTATGTRLLPVPRSNVTPEDVVRIDRLLRELKHNPEKWIEREGTLLEKFAAQALVAEKLRLLAEIPERGAGFDRHQSIEKVNWELENYYVSRGREELLAERSTIKAELRHQEILGSREFSFCLYPEATLRPWLLDAAARAL